MGHSIVSQALGMYYREVLLFLLCSVFFSCLERNLRTLIAVLLLCIYFLFNIVELVVLFT